MHFENRKIVPVTFLLKPIYVNKGYMFTLELKVNHTEVKNIRAFLLKVKEGLPNKLSSTFIFDTNHYCFSKQTDEVIQQLIELASDDQVTNSYSNKQLLIPPSAWKNMMPLLEKELNVKLVYNHHSYEGIHVSQEALPTRLILKNQQGKAFN